MSKQIPVIKESNKLNFISSIWIIPIIAMIIAGWLAYQYFEGRGPEIEIVFPENEGLVAGQSVVKFRNVPVGKVTKIHVEDDVEGVIVTVRMNSKRSNPYLTEKAQFWIVKPEVGLSGISGLETLLSGTYINVYSEKGGKRFKKRFVGLNQPYRDSMEGEYFHLVSGGGDGISVGMPIYFKSIKVGQVEYVYLSLNHKTVDVIVFINKLYTSLVHDDSKFWIKSTFNVDFTKGNLDVNVAPASVLLQGGISFSSGDNENNATINATNKIFPIYKNKSEAESKTTGSIKNIKKFVLETDISTANLKVYSPVRFYKYDIGWVEKIDMNYDLKSHKIRSRVLIDLDTSVFRDVNEKNATGVENFYKAVNEGLRAKLQTLDPLSGMLYVNLTFDHHEGNASIEKEGGYAFIPTVETYSEGIMESATKIMDKLSNLPLETLVDSLDKAIRSTKEPIANANEMLLELKKSAKNFSEMTSKKSFERLPNEANIAIKEFTRTLKSTRKVIESYGSDSMLTQQLSYTLEILTKTSKEMEVFLRMLNRKPNSLIFGD